MSTWPVYELRPPGNYFDGEFFRYADGAWIPDDGEYDLAFSGRVGGTPVALYVDLPYYENILWSWCSGHWSAKNPKHRDETAWHRILRDGAKDWGRSLDRESFENSRAGTEAMRYTSNKHGCANGRHAEFSKGNEIINKRLLRERGTKRVFVPPEGVCFECGGKP